MTRSPRQSVDRYNERLLEFLIRAILYRAELSEPKNLAWFLASYAHVKVDAAGGLLYLYAVLSSPQGAT
jgi:hypothetical protein